MATKYLIYLYEMGSWKIQSTSPLLSYIQSFFILPSGKIWGVGENGLIINWDGKEWKQVSSPTNNTLMAVQMISETDGWIVGANGVILRYSPEIVSCITSKQLGFKQNAIPTAAKIVNDEYGVAMADVNNDGTMDIYTAGIFESNHLYIKRNAAFHEEAQARGVHSQPYEPRGQHSYDLHLGVALGDIDNDDDVDIYVCTLNGKNKFFLNNGNGYFYDYSNKLGAEGAVNDRTNAAVFGDVDNDGDLDLFVTNEGTSNRMYLNDGNGYYNDVT